MPSTSASTATRVADYGVAEDRSAELDGYAVNFVTIKQTHDLAPMLAALPVGANAAYPAWLGFLVLVTPYLAGALAGLICSSSVPASAAGAWPGGM